MWEDFSFYKVSDSEPYREDSSSTLYLNHKLFNEYASLFHLRHRLQDLKNTHALITICQYRRFVFNKKIGRQSRNMPWCMVLTHEEILSLDVKSEYLPSAGNSYLIGSAVKVTSILEQYAKMHFLRDILQFTSRLIDTGVFTNQKALNFLNSEFLIPSPSCGTFPLKCFVTIFDTLEFAAKSFLNNGYKAYDDDYQSRVMSFLLERLNSYLLITYLLNESLDVNKLIGKTTMVTPKNSNLLDVQRGLISMQKF
jgi:hypothetical protein